MTMNVTEYPTYRMKQMLGESLDTQQGSQQEDLKLIGSNEAFHNVATAFAGSGQFKDACLVLEKGLELYPKETDLLADYLNYGVRAGEMDKAGKYFGVLYEIPHDRYTWRSFTFIIDYLISCNKTGIFGDKVNKDNLKNTCQKLVREYKAYLPGEEKAYIAEYNVKASMGAKTNDLLNVLKDGVSKVTVSPQCCLKIVDISLESGDYQSVLDYAQRGLSVSAQEQESVDSGYFYYATALAMDAKWRDVNDPAYKEPEYGKEIIKMYRTADLSLDENKTTYRKVIKKRANMIAFEMDIDIPFQK